jgi:hypothetical protein
MNVFISGIKIVLESLIDFQFSCMELMGSNY